MLSYLLLWKLSLRGYDFPKQNGQSIDLPWFEGIFLLFCWRAGLWLLRNLLNSSFCQYLTPKTYAVNFHDFNVWGFTETSCFSDASAPQHLLWYPWGFPRDSCSRWPAHRVRCCLQPRYLPPVHASSCHTGAQKTLCQCVTVGSEASSHPGGRTGVRYSLGMVS